MYYSNLQVNYMPLEPSPEPLLTVVPPEVATVNDLQCEQLAVDPTPTAGVLGDTTAPVLPLDLSLIHI